MTVTPVREDDPRPAYAAGLRALADVLEANPGSVPLPYDGTTAGLNFMFLFGDDPRADLAEAARAIPCNWRKRVSPGDDENDGDDGGNFYLDGRLHGLKLTLIAHRATVCERVVTGTREITQTVKDPEALAKVPEIEVTKVIEEVEWRCSSVLAQAAQPESTVAA